MLLEQIQISYKNTNHICTLCIYNEVECAGLFGEWKQYSLRPTPPHVVISLYLNPVEADEVKSSPDKHIPPSLFPLKGQVWVCRSVCRSRDHCVNTLQE